MQDHKTDEIAKAFAAESASAARNDLYARKMAKGGETALAPLLAALAESERVLARRILMVLRGKMGDTETYLTELEALKRLDAEQRFPDIAGLLAESGENKSADNFSQFAQVASNQLDWLRRKSEAQESADYRVCSVCGYIIEGQPPDHCPVCNAVADKFIGGN
jgi:rubrerythrin